MQCEHYIEKDGELFNYKDLKRPINRISPINKYRDNANERIDRTSPIKSKLFIKLIEVLDGNYSKIGTQLVRLAVELSIKYGFEGRVSLEASWSSHVFWHKIGFCALLDKDEEKIIAAYKKEQRTRRRQDTSELGSVPMTLPSCKIDEYRNSNAEFITKLT